VREFLGIDRANQRSRLPIAAIALFWASTRLPLYVVQEATFPRRGDVVTYGWWTHYFLHGHFPAGDGRWQYPPGAAAVLSLPHLLPGDYVGAFLTVTLLTDMAITALLANLAVRNGCWWGCWCWVIGIPLLGSTPLVRFDLFPTLCAVIAICLANSRFGLGVFSGLGATIKAWPVLLLLGVRPNRVRTALAALVATGGAVLLFCLAFTHGSLDFLSNQKARGIEVEAVAAVPFLVLHRLRLWHGMVRNQYGSVQLSGAGVAAVSLVATALSVIAVLAIVLWRTRTRWRPTTVADTALVATLIAVVTSRVLSPQYVVWLLGVAGCALAFPKSSQRPVAGLVVAAAFLTLLDFPVFFSGLHFDRLISIGVVAARDIALVVATVMGAVRLYRAHRPAAVPSEPRVPALTASPRPG
jgi:hypothetical protein